MSVTSDVDTPSVSFGESTSISFANRDGIPSLSKTGNGKNKINVLFLVIYTLQVVGSGGFLYWLFTRAWNPKSPVTSGLFFAAEIIAFISNTLFLFCGIFSGDGDEDQTPKRNARGDSQGSDDEKPHVAVCVCRYKEPLEDLILTVNSMLDIDWPADKLHLYILDDGYMYQDEAFQRRQTLELIRIIPEAGPIASDDTPLFDEVSVHLPRPDCATKTSSWRIRAYNASGGEHCEVTLVARTKPTVTHYKAGNINNFLYNHCSALAEKGEAVPQFMLLLDHDMLPAPCILRESLPYFDDEKLAFLQFPQRFFDIATKDIFYAGNEIFFDGVQVNRSNIGLTAFAGTNAVWRMNAFYHVGGMQYGSLTEDTNTGLAVHELGYTSKYSCVELCVGQSPQTVPDAMRQRMRWSQGALEMLLFRMSVFFRCKRAYPRLPCPKPLEAYVPTKLPPPRPLEKRIAMNIIYFDSMIYPLYSIGFVVHVAVCLLYLLNIQAPMAPENPMEVLMVWLPLYCVKVATQLLAFPHVSLKVELNAQRAWAGYSLSTLASIKDAVKCFNCGTSNGWFNTGSGSKDRFWFQYGNLIFTFAIIVGMAYRIVAFAVMDKTCKAWMTFGALVYGIVLLMHVKDWAFEPLKWMVYQHSMKEAKEASKAGGEEDLQQHPSAMRESWTLPSSQHSMMKRTNEASESGGEEGPKQRPSTKRLSWTRSSSISRSLRTSWTRTSSFSRSLRLESSVAKWRAQTPSQQSIGFFHAMRRASSSGMKRYEFDHDEVNQSFENGNKNARIFELIREREAYEKHSADFSVIITFLLIIMISCTLTVWATGHCDDWGADNRVEARPLGQEIALDNAWCSANQYQCNACSGDFDFTPTPSLDRTMTLRANGCRTSYDVFQEMHTITKELSSNPLTLSILAEGGIAGDGGFTVSEGQAYGILASAIALASLDRSDRRRLGAIDMFYGYFNGWKKMCENSSPAPCQSIMYCNGYVSCSCGIPFWYYLREYLDFALTHITSLYFERGKTACLPGWKHTSDLSTKIGDDAAPDADADAIVGMIIALKALEDDPFKPEWYNNLREWTERSCTQFLADNTVLSSSKSHRLLKLGTCWGGWNSAGNNPSYHAPGAFRIMRDFQINFGPRSYNFPTMGDTLSLPEKWNSLIDTSYKFLETVKCPESSLVPNWALVQELDNSTLGNYPGTFSAAGTPQREFGSEASRTMWRVTLDAAVYPDESTDQARDFLTPLLEQMVSTFDPTVPTGGNYFPGLLSKDMISSCDHVTSVSNGDFWWKDGFMFGPLYSTLVHHASDELFQGKSFTQQTMVDTACNITSNVAGTYYSRSWNVLSTMTLNGDVARVGQLLR